MTPSPQTSPVVIADQVGARLTCAAVLRLLVSVWCLPAAALLWVAGGSLGLWSARPDRMVRMLQLAQATTVLLALITLIVGAIWAVRTWSDHDAPTGGAPTGRPFRLQWHGVAAIAAAAVAMAAGELDEPSIALWWSAAGLALAGALALPRWVRRVRTVPSSAPAGFVAVLTVQATLGWIPLMAGAGGLPAPSVALVLTQGLLLAGSAASATRIVPDAGPVLVGERAASHAGPADDPVAGDVGRPTGGFSPAPGPPSFRGPAVGH